MLFYISNYGTEMNLNIFKTYEEAKEDSCNSVVHTTDVNEEFVYQEDDGQWNYEDTSVTFEDDFIKVDPVDWDVIKEALEIAIQHHEQDLSESEDIEYREHLQHTIKTIEVNRRLL
jgi:hypothetical protein